MGQVFRNIWIEKRKGLAWYLIQIEKLKSRISLVVDSNDTIVIEANQDGLKNHY